MDDVKKLNKYSLIFGILYSIQAGLAIFFAFAMKNVINTAVYGGNFKLWAIIFASVCIGMPVLRWIVRYTNQRLTDREVKSLRLKFLNIIMTRDFEEIRKFHTGVLVSRTGSDIRAIIERKTKTSPLIIGQVVQLIGALIVLFYMNSMIAILAILIGIILVVFGFAFRKVIRKKQIEIKSANEAVISNITEIAENPEITRTVLSGKEINSRLGAKLENWLNIKKGLTLISTIGSSLFSSAIQIGMCILVIWGAFQIGKGNLLYGDLVAMMQIVSLFKNPISGLTGIQAKLAAYDASLERVNEIMEIDAQCHYAQCHSERSEESSDCRPQIDKTKPQTDKVESHSERSEESSAKQIQLNSISFRYTDEKEHVFSDFSLDIKTDEWTALTGISGQGKTTLLRILLGLVAPESGEVRKSKDLKLAYVPQEPVLFSGTIRENMLLAKPEATDDEIRNALDICKAGFVPRDGGLDMKISQFGNGLSVGQKQRITVARTILAAKGENAFLLLDEPTSAVDSETAESLLVALKESFRGALVATHTEVSNEIFANEICID